MRLLLDTHTLLWTLVAPDRLSKNAAQAIAAEESEVFVSIVSPWEMERLEAQLETRRFVLLPVSLRHTHVVETLPHHHRDPFDRMLVAQAQVEGLTIVTVDRLLRRYPVSLLPAV